MRYIITSDELAQALGTTRHAILQHRAGVRQSRVLQGLPEPIACKPRLKWLVVDIEEWLASRRTFRPDNGTAGTIDATAPRRGPGRPRKGSAA